MMQMIECENCRKNKAGIHLSFKYESICCNECHHFDIHTWDYWFCDLSCFFKWTKDNEIEEKGFPCQDCFDHMGDPPYKSTGWGSGYESNGVCKLCNGTMRIKDKVFLNNDYERIEDPYPF